MIAAANFDESAGSQASDRRNPRPSATAPEPDDSEELFELGERIADLAARINAAEGRMLRLLADFDRRAVGGTTSPRARSGWLGEPARRSDRRASGFGRPGRWKLYREPRTP